MKKIFLIAALFAAAITAPVTTSAQMYNSATGAKVSHAFPVGAYGTNNYVPFPCTHDSTLKSADTIKPVIWASQEFVNVDTMKLHLNILKLTTPKAAVLGVATPLTGYQLYVSAHTYDSVRPLYIMQPNGTVTDTISVSKSKVRAGFIYKVASGFWEKFF